MTKPILFNTAMVRAILEGRKTVTRRVVKGQEAGWELVDVGDNAAMIKVRPNGEEYPVDVPGLWATFEWDGVPDFPMVKAPYEPGDILWVRETWCESMGQAGKYFYRAYVGPRDEMKEYAHSFNRWRPSIHMPKEAARLFLRVTGVRVERLQDMTEEDAFAEGYEDKVWCEHPVYENYPDSPIPCYAAGNPGCPPDSPCNHSIPELFGSEIWDSTIKPADRPLYGWESNPWVWVIQFERCEKPEGF